MKAIKAHVLIAGKPFPTGNDACPNIINTKCPLTKGEAVVYERINTVRNVAAVSKQPTTQKNVVNMIVIILI